MTRLLTLLLFISLGAISCGKEEGPQGPKGEKGEKGDPGQPGAAGTNGATILSGSGSPSTSTGRDGDFYLDLTSAALYGPKTNGSWGNSISLKGEKGNPGENGASLLGGDNAPGLGVGKVGDFYFHKTELAIYGPKTAAGWGFPISLKPTGQTGALAVVYKDLVVNEYAAGSINDYYRTRPYFYFRKQFYLNNIDLHKGITNIYWNYVEPNSPNEPINESNFSSIFWTKVETNRGDITINEPNGISYTFRLDVKGATFLNALLVGSALKNGQAAAVEDVLYFANNYKFNILIQHIPYSSVDILTAQGVDLDNINEVAKHVEGTVIFMER